MPDTTHGRPVENTTRVNVAFPFAKIITTNPELTDTVHELLEIVAALATEVDGRHSTQATAELATRAHNLQEGFAGTTGT